VPVSSPITTVWDYCIPTLGLGQGVRDVSHAILRFCDGIDALSTLGVVTGQAVTLAGGHPDYSSVGSSE
jgi:hypothetical protein